MEESHRVLIVEDDTELAERMDRIVYLDDGRISSER